MSSFEKYSKDVQISLKRINNLYKDRQRYKEAYDILMDYFNELSHESRDEIDKKLNKLKLWNQ